MRFVLVGLPTIFTFIGLVIAAQVGMRFWNLDNIKDPEKPPSFITKMIPFVVYTLLLIIF